MRSRSRQLFDGQELPSQRGGRFDQVPGSLAHLAEPIFDPDYMIPEGSEPYVADRNWYSVRVGPDGSPRSVLVIAKGERVDPARIEAIKAEQTMFGLDPSIEHARTADRRPVSADPKEDSDLASREHRGQAAPRAAGE